MRPSASGECAGRTAKCDLVPTVSRASQPGYVVLVASELGVTIVYEPGEDGWVIAWVPEVAGVFSQGRTREEARENVLDALRLMLSPLPRSADDGREREALHLTLAL
jgi:predicted RNase H-like HicB family nuclease